MILTRFEQTSFVSKGSPCDAKELFLLKDPKGPLKILKGFSSNSKGSPSDCKEIRLRVLKGLLMIFNDLYFTSMDIDNILKDTLQNLEIFWTF